jgi:hypothetical protein
MKTKVFFLAVSLGALIATPLWAQQESADANLMGQLQQRLAQSESKTAELTGEPRQVWLLRTVEIEKAIDQVQAGQSVDPHELDQILKGEVNY